MSDFYRFPNCNQTLSTFITSDTLTAEGLIALLRIIKEYKLQIDLEMCDEGIWVFVEPVDLDLKRYKRSVAVWANRY